jgi:hypothetical protein
MSRRYLEEPVESAAHERSEERHERTERKLIGRLARHAAHAPPHPGIAQERRTIGQLQRMARAERRQEGGPVAPGSPTKAGIEQSSLGDILQAGARAADAGVRFMTRLPNIYDAYTREVEGFAERHLPTAVSNAMREARQFVETDPRVRRHTLGDVAGSIERTTGYPIGNMPGGIDPSQIVAPQLRTGPPVYGTRPWTVQPPRPDEMPQPAPAAPRYLGPAIVDDKGDVSVYDPINGLRLTDNRTHSVQQDGAGHWHVFEQPQPQAAGRVPLVDYEPPLPTLTAVDHDPWAGHVPLTPVEHNPFLGANVP